MAKRICSLGSVHKQCFLWIVAIPNYWGILKIRDLFSHFSHYLSQEWKYDTRTLIIYPRSLYFLTGSFKEVYFNCLPIYSEILILQCNCFFFNKTSWKAFWHLCNVYLVSSFTGDCIRSNYLCPQTNAVYLIKGKKTRLSSKVALAQTQPTGCGVFEDMPF